MEIFKRFFEKTDVEQLKETVDQGEAVRKMTKTDGWKLLEQHFQEQQKAYQAELLIGCKNWDEYQEKRGKAFAIQLLLVDVEEFIRHADEAAAKLKTLNHP